jgi:hypothetical protein
MIFPLLICYGKKLVIVSFCEFLKIFDLTQKYLKIFGNLLILAKNIDKCVFILKFKHNYS